MNNGVGLLVFGDFVFGALSLNLSLALVFLERALGVIITLTLINYQSSIRSGEEKFEKKIRFDMTRHQIMASTTTTTTRTTVNNTSQRCM